MGFTQDFVSMVSGESLTSGQTAVHGTDYTSSEENIGGLTRSALTVRATSDSASTSTVDFYVESSVDGGSNWDDSGVDQNTYAIVTLELRSTATVQRTVILDVDGLSNVRIGRIVNNSSVALSDVAADLGYEQ